VLLVTPAAAAPDGAFPRVERRYVAATAAPASEAVAALAEGVSRVAWSARAGPVELRRRSPRTDLRALRRPWMLSLSGRPGRVRLALHGGLLRRRMRGFLCHGEQRQSRKDCRQRHDDRQAPNFAHV
jgi:hypothetical protein